MKNKDITTEPHLVLFQEACPKMPSPDKGHECLQWTPRRLHSHFQMKLLSFGIQAGRD